MTNKSSKYEYEEALNQVDKSITERLQKHFEVIEKRQKISHPATQAIRNSFIYLKKTFYNL